MNIPHTCTGNHVIEAFAKRYVKGEYTDEQFKPLAYLYNKGKSAEEMTILAYKTFINKDISWEEANVIVAASDKAYKKRQIARN